MSFESVAASTVPTTVYVRSASERVISSPMATSSLASAAGVVMISPLFDGARPSRTSKRPSNRGSQISPPHTCIPVAPPGVCTRTFVSTTRSASVPEGRSAVGSDTGVPSGAFDASAGYPVHVGSVGDCQNPLSGSPRTAIQASIRPSSTVARSCAVPFMLTPTIA